MQKLVLFGAGKIGRSFIAQLFSKAGYETVFIDIDTRLIELINRRKEFNVIIKDKQEEVIKVKNVRAIHFSDSEKITKEISSASILATSVGQKGLPSLFPLLAEGLKLRLQKTKQPLDIIIAENIRNADQLFEKELKKYLSDDYPFQDLVGLVESSIGKMVPIMTVKDLEEDPLQIFTEAYNTLPVDAKAFKKPIPQVPGLAPKQNMKAWVDKKSFIHNLGHAAAAYFGFLKMPEETLLWRVLEEQSVLQNTRKAMLQSATVLHKKYPDAFTFADLEHHTDDLLARFQNRALDDTEFRVGCDLYRKLSKNDRLAGAVHLALEEKLPYNKILEALVAGFFFRATDESGKLLSSDLKFIEELSKNGFISFFPRITGLFEDKIINQANQINQQFRIE